MFDELLYKKIVLIVQHLYVPVADCLALPIAELNAWYEVARQDA